MGNINKFLVKQLKIDIQYSRSSQDHSNLKDEQLKQ